MERSSVALRLVRTLVERFRADRRHSGWIAFYAVLSLLLLLPHVFSTRWSEQNVGLARVYSGDEPHYLVQINSLARDRDFDISNNYDWALAGADDAGRPFRNWPLERHMAAQTNKGLVLWQDSYDVEQW